MILIAASAFGAFALFLLLGLLALPVTAGLDKSLGKEKGLLLYAVVLLAFTFFVLSPERPGKRSVKPGKETDVPAEPLVQQGDPFARPDPDHEIARNAFRPYSDTRDLPPVALELPPWIPFEYALPPTVPGPAPGHRSILRGPRPVLTKEDGSAIAEFPEAVFRDYEVQPEDVFDWITPGNAPTYVIILGIHDGDRLVREGDPEYERLKWVLAENGDGYDKLRVQIAYVGPADKAKEKVDPLARLKARRTGVTMKKASDEEIWYLRRSVDNLHAEALNRAFGRRVLPTSQIDPDKLRRAAKEMKAVGELGKESKAGWRRAVELLELALVEVRANRGAPERAEVLLELLEAQHALRDEKAVLRTLAEYMETAPNSAEARTWLGNLHLEGMQLPEVSLRYFEDALVRKTNFAPALIGRGDALSYVGLHEEALRSYGRAGTNEARLKRAASELRTGQLDRARGSAESILSRDPSDQYATLLRACALYCSGDLDTARAAFEQVAASPDAQQIRAMACYNLGLTCVRKGQHDAALAAFDACQKALEQGSSKGPTPDETVSASLGRAIVAFAVGDADGVATHLEQARREAPRNSYLEMFSGMTASLEGNDASAVRALDAALRRAPAYGELDGLLGLTYLRLGTSAVTTGAPIKEVADTFERATAFATRAANRESSADAAAYKARLRECIVRLGAAHLPNKERYEEALQAAVKVLDNSKHRENPPALALAAYCNFQLGAYDEKAYDECIRRFQDVLRIVPDEEEGPWKAWRDYADQALTTVKHWRMLEEKLVTFDSPTLARDMLLNEKHGVDVSIEEGRLHFHDEANDDGSPDDPTVAVWTKALFTKDSFESVSMNIRIPRTDRQGRATNNVCFGVRVLGKGRGAGGGKAPGIGVFYDRNKVAVRIGGGQDKQYKAGDLQRMQPEKLWPEDEEVELRIERMDEEPGMIAAYLNGELVIKDKISAFKQGRGDATLWIGGHADLTQPFDIWVSDIRVVRKRK